MAKQSQKMTKCRHKWTTENLCSIHDIRECTVCQCRQVKDPMYGGKYYLMKSGVYLNTTKKVPECIKSKHEKLMDIAKGIQALNIPPYNLK